MAASCAFISMARQKNRSGRRSHGQIPRGLSTKIYAAVDAMGNPVRLLLTPGQASKYRQAEALIEGFTPRRYWLTKAMTLTPSLGYPAQGRGSGHPSKRNRLKPRQLDRHLYKARNLVERFFQKLKQFRRIATRYERLARNYQSMLSLVSAVIWLA